MIKIKITGVPHTPTWVTLQEIVREMLDDQSIVFTKLKRRDRCVNYHACGKYKVKFRTSRGYEMSLKLTVRSGN